MAAAETEDTLVETIRERFIAIYGTPERSKKHWDQWMSVQSEAGRSIIEQMAETTAEEQGISLEAAQGRLAVEKVIQDLGIDYAEKYLTKHDAAALKASRALKPMTTVVKKGR